MPAITFHTTAVASRRKTSSAGGCVTKKTRSRCAKPLYSNSRAQRCWKATNDCSRCRDQQPSDLKYYAFPPPGPPRQENTAAMAAANYTQPPHQVPPRSRYSRLYHRADHTPDSLTINLPTTSSQDSSLSDGSRNEAPMEARTVFGDQ